MQEIWKDIKGYEGLYKISNTGKVASYDRIIRGMCGEPKLHKGRELKKRLTLGYNQVVLTQRDGTSKQYKVHRLVLEHFVGPAPEGYVCNHKDGDRCNNSLDNLERVDKSHNMLHGIHVLGHKPGVPPMGKYSKCSKRVIQKNKDNSLVKKWYCMSDIERELGYDQGNISTACKKGCIMYGYKRELA